MIKVIALDMDGTLLNSQKQLPPDFDRAVEKLSLHGVHVVIASGRQYFNLIEKFPNISDKLCFITDNGALGFEGERQIFVHPTPRGPAEAAFLACDHLPDVMAVICGAKAAYFRKPSPVGEQNARLYMSRMNICEDPLAESRKDDLIKVSFFHPVSSEKACGAALKPFEKDLKICLAGTVWTDAMDPSVNKGRALLSLAKHFGVGPDECMAFGDFMNDYEMVTSVKYGYAMENGYEKLKADAPFIAPSNDNDGVMTVLRQYFDYL